MPTDGPERTVNLGTIASSSIAAFVTILATASGYSAEGIAFAGAAAQLVTLLGYDNLARRGETYISTFRRVLFECNEGDFDEVVREQAKDPIFRNTIFHSFRALRDAMDDCIAPALAVLTADYTVPKLRPVDAFFRGMGDLLRDLSADEYRDFVAFIEELARVKLEQPLQGTYEERYYIGSVGRPVGKLVVAASGPYQANARVVHEFASVSRGHSLLMLITRHSLFGDFSGAPGTVKEHRNTVTTLDGIASIDEQTLQRILSILRRAQAADR